MDDEPAGDDERAAELGGGIDPTADPGADPSTMVEGQLDPDTTLNGSQITAGIAIVEKALAQTITIPAATVLLRVGLGVDPEDVEEMLSGAEEAIAARELKAAEMQAQIAAGSTQPPGNEPDDNPSPEDDDGEEDEQEDQD
jgi:hypothetical protein